ncbi:hypothetical protein LWI29_032917 [Acer saccharum]|uniref:Uncharacterized protein n=1 Tax=Acer saccharum TaxID=4024 RepID=A0AA39W4U3_ACESA|nr:hypothetical protein LWI29_032917 [Acer saccharum]
MIANLDLPPVFDEEIFDKESMSADFDPKPELVEEECHAAKVDKEASLGIGDQSAPKFNNIGVVDSGNTAEEHGSAMVDVNWKGPVAGVEAALETFKAEKAYPMRKIHEVSWILW